MPRYLLNRSLRPFRPGVVTTLLIVNAVLFGPAAPSADAQTIRVRADGLLEIADPPPDTVVRYTLDGTEPTRDAGVWLAPVNVPPGYTVKARAFTADHAPAGATMTWASTAAKGPRIASSLVPVTQGRDWRVYDWPKRHAAIVALTIDAINQRIAKLQGRDGVVTYLDIGQKFLGADGSISKDVMYDFLHPSAKGYEIWVEAMKPTLTRLLSIP